MQSKTLNLEVIAPAALSAYTSILSPTLIIPFCIWRPIPHIDIKGTYDLAWLAN